MNINPCKANLIFMDKFESMYALLTLSHITVFASVCRVKKKVFKDFQLLYLANANGSLQINIFTHALAKLLQNCARSTDVGKSFYRLCNTPVSHLCIYISMCRTCRHFNEDADGRSLDVQNVRHSFKKEYLNLI